jgi:phospholipase/carboxylesterase
MWAFRRCLPEHCNIIAPQAPQPDELGGYSWWDVNTGGAGVDAATPSLQLLQRFIDGSPRFYGLAPQSQVAFGFSQGAGILSLLLQSGAHALAGVALLAGFVIEAAEVSGSPRPRVFMAHGTNDDIIPLSRAHRGKAYLEKHGFEVAFHEDAVGHKVGAPSMRHLSAWSSAALDIRSPAA